MVSETLKDSPTQPAAMWKDLNRSSAVRKLIACKGAAMKSTAALVLLTVLALLPVCTLSQAAVGQSAATVADEHWLALMDAAQYDGAWKTSAPVMQNALTEPQFAKAMAGARDPLGIVERRTLKDSQATEHLPGAPDGHYVVSRYTTNFAHKSDGVETVVASQSDDGTWHVSGYFIR